jgi:hypothetical protein
MHEILMHHPFYYATIANHSPSTSPSTSGKTEVTRELDYY